MNKLAAAFAIVSAFTFANAANYRFDLYQTTTVNGTTFKPGECKIELNDNQVVLKQGKNSAAAAVKLESAPQKFVSTSVGYNANGQLQEIRLGGTNTKVLFDVNTQSASAAGR